ncbi:GerMN domain-containing protein [Planococcus shixiaomingii]|uniref:GerMN domain-containing protein n=1 Tax=Planococcus shixiaomingii TaxID=3058393 RepID=UPI00261E76BD|nr:GerMN domain-containing protein [Planococcus sp. N022]WKA53386.1 GerMN domain-containing protein [Planococcus sp. N022]
MSNNKWDEEYIESLLGDFPAIQDERPKEEIYQRLAKKSPTQKRQRNWLPLLVAALAFITVGILIASILSQNGINSASQQESSKQSAESAATSKEADSDASGGSAAESNEESQESQKNEESADFSIMQTPDINRTAVYDSDLTEATLFTIGMTENAYVIPISFLIPNEQLERDFENGTPNSVDLYNKYAPNLDEQALGFDDYHPYLGTISKTDQGAAHMLPNDHKYDEASASIGVYIASIQETFKDVEEVAVLNEDGTPAEFGQVGPMEPIKTGAENVAYHAFTTASEATYLIPSYGMPFGSAAEAVEALAASPSDFQQATIPEGTNFSVTETDELVAVEFTEPFDLEALDPIAASRMVESLALTTQSFGKQVQLNNMAQEQWNEFDFTQPIAAPLAPNKLEWPLK